MVVGKTTIKNCRRHPTSELAKQHRRRSIKEVKTQQVEKHRRRQQQEVMTKDIPDYLREYDLDQDWGFTPVSKAPETLQLTLKLLKIIM